MITKRLSNATLILTISAIFIFNRRYYHLRILSCPISSFLRQTPDPFRPLPQSHSIRRRRIRTRMFRTPRLPTLLQEISIKPSGTRGSCCGPVPCSAPRHLPIRHGSNHKLCRMRVFSINTRLLGVSLTVSCFMQSIRRIGSRTVRFQTTRLRGMVTSVCIKCVCVHQAGLSPDMPHHRNSPCRRCVRIRHLGGRNERRSLHIRRSTGVFPDSKLVGDQWRSPVGTLLPATRSSRKFPLSA